MSFIHSPLPMLPPLALAALACMVARTPVDAGEAPRWWTRAPTAIWDGSSTEHRAPINVGQLKHVATMAKKHLESTLGPIDWDLAYSPHPSPFPFSESGGNRAPANVGQLKAVALGFYRVLEAAGYPTARSLQFQGVSPADISEWRGATVPWKGGRSESYSPVNIGQLKAVFSFAVNPDGSSAFDLSGISEVDTGGTADADRDLWSGDLEAFMGLNAGFNGIASVLSQPLNEEFEQALSDDLDALPGAAGPVLVLPNRGIYRVQRPELQLRYLLR